MKKTYTKPDIRISPIWQRVSSKSVWLVREDGCITMIVESNGMRTPHHGWIDSRDEYVPLLPLGQEPPLIIEPGKHYRTRGGRKVFIGYWKGTSNECFVGHFADNGSVTTWTRDGAFSPGVESGKDLIAEWEES